MGWFSSTTTISVASTTYNLADPDEDDPTYLESSLLSAVMFGGPKTYLGETVVSNHLSGPGIAQRRFFNWAKLQDFSGLPVFSLSNERSLDQDTVKTEIATEEGLTEGNITMTSAVITAANYGYFAEQYMLVNHPTLYVSDWISEFNNDGSITIQFEDTTTEDFTPSGFDVSGQYIVAEFDYSGTATMFIYLVGSGNTVLDAFGGDLTDYDTREFFPFIPVRINNVGIDATTYVNNGLFAESQAAYERHFPKSTFEALLDSVTSNPSIGEIDYAFVSFGIPLNTADNSARKYLYDFFKAMISYQNVSGITTIRLHSEHASLGSIDIRLSWTDIDEDIVLGLGKVDAVRNEVWLETGASQLITIYHQVDETFYKKLTIDGLYHQNYVYGGKWVNINAHTALADTDITGFIVPLHAPTLSAMSIIDSTQLSAANSFIVFNSYSIYKQKWYEKKIFKILLIVAAIVLAVVTAGASLGATVGILGTNLAVGTALGLSGTAAVIAGAVANALVAIVITRLITDASVSLFGDKNGAIIGAILSFVTMTAATGGFAGVDFASMANVENVMKLANVLANGYQGWTEANIADIGNEMAQNTSEYESTLESINELMEKLGGRTNNLSFDPLRFTDVNNGNDQGIGGYLPEGLDEFIHRTTMTGSDMVAITHNLINNYADLSLQLPRN